MWRRSSLTSGLHILSYPADRWYLGRACIYPMCGILILPTAYNRSKNKGVCHMSQETLLALIIISPFLIALIALPFWDTISGTKKPSPLNATEKDKEGERRRSQYIPRPCFNRRSYNSCFSEFCKRYPGHFACPGNDNCVECWGCPYKGC